MSPEIYRKQSLGLVVPLFLAVKLFLRLEGWSLDKSYYLISEVVYLHILAARGFKMQGTWEYGTFKRFTP